MTPERLEKIQQELDYCNAFGDRPPMWCANELFAEVNRLNVQIVALRAGQGTPTGDTR